MSYLNSKKQDTLVSGTNIKTINTQSLLGSGNISISGATLADGDYGDITVGSSGTTMTIDNLAVTNAKINDVDWSKVTGEPTTLSGYGISDTKANFDTACSDGNFLYVGDIVGVTDGWTTIVKSANQDVTNNATPQDDTDLTFSVVAGGHYMVEMNICYSGNNASGDYKLVLTPSAGTLNGRITTASYNSTLSPLVQAGAFPTQITVGTSADIDDLFHILITASFTASADATVKYQFANAAAAAGRTSRTWKGSILKYKRID